MEEAPQRGRPADFVIIIFLITILYPSWSTYIFLNAKNYDASQPASGSEIVYHFYYLPAQQVITPSEPTWELKIESHRIQIRSQSFRRFFSLSGIHNAAALSGRVRGRCYLLFFVRLYALVIAHTCVWLALAYGGVHGKTVRVHTSIIWAKKSCSLKRV